MIHDVDDSLRKLVLRDAVDGSGVEISFEAPTKEWAARRNAPTISVYLYDVREDVDRREVELEPVRGEDGRVLERRLPPRRFKLSYLVTVWTQRPLRVDATAYLKGSKNSLFWTVWTVWQLASCTRKRDLARTSTRLQIKHS